MKKLYQSWCFLQRRKVLKFIVSLIVGISAAIAVAVHLAVPTTSTVNSYTTSWIGNTFSGGKKWVQNHVKAMYVTPDGTVYTNSGWDEAGKEAGIYKNGDVIVADFELHGWSRSGGKAITGNSKYIYLAMTQGALGQRENYPPEGTTWYCVRRYNLSGKPVGFEGGQGYDQSMLVVSTQGEVTGLATAGAELYVSNSAANQIHVYNTETMKAVREFSVANPGAIAVDRQGNLWIIQRQKDKASAKIVHYSKQGKQLPEVITDVVDPSAIAIDNQGRLLIADNGPRQQILIYNTATQPKLVGTFGAKGGVYSGVSGEVQDLKLYGITGVGTDATGNIYVSSDGFHYSGSDLRKFSPTGKLQWQLLGLHFVDNADADSKTDGLDVFAKHEHFVMNYSKAPGQQWTYKGYTLNPFKYPQDPRLHISSDAPFVRRIKGQRFMFLTNMYNHFLLIYRFNPSRDGEIAVPSGMFVGTNGGGKKSISGDWPPNQPEKGEWIWRDRNGNGDFEANEFDRSEDYPYMGGWWVDNQGDVWKALRTLDGIGIRHFPLQGLDAHGNPIYTYSSMQKQPTPSMFNDLRRIEYLPDTDTMYLSGFTHEHPKVNDDAKLVGSELVRFDNWSKGNTKPTWRIVLPVDRSKPPEALTPAAISVEKDYVFAVTVKTAEVYVYNARTGKQVKILRPGSEVFNESGWIDIPYGIRAFRRANGEYLVFVEEDAKGKVILYRFQA